MVDLYCRIGVLRIGNETAGCILCLINYINYYSNAGVLRNVVLRMSPKKGSVNDFL